MRAGNLFLKPTGLLIAFAVSSFAIFSFAGLTFAQTSVHSKKKSTKPHVPYQAMVVNDDADVYSGPGNVHYPTTRLKTGQMVEVYRHDPGGWCAVRPPDGSFSLVAGSAIEELPDGIGKILQDGTQVWIGTELGPVEKPLWQVKLVKGEKIEILGVAQWPDAEGFSVDWYQISPPAGEFRWIHEDNLRFPPSSGSGSNVSELNSSSENQLTGQNPSQAGLELLPTLRGSYAESNVDAVEGDVSPMEGIASSLSRLESSHDSTSSLGWRRARTPILNTEQAQQQDANWNAMIVAATGTGSLTWNSDANLNSNFSANSPPQRLASADLNSTFGLAHTTGALGGGNAMPGRLTPRLTELEMKLNQEVIKAPNLWRLTDLQMVAEHVLESSGDTLEKLQAQRFLEKIANCRQIRDRYLSNPNNAELFAARNASASNRAIADRNNGVNENRDLSLDTLYDAHGRLNELVREAGKRESTFVLQDENGKITHHVLPAPGGSLSSYVGKRIGIIGQRGFHTRLNLDHITAQRIIELK